ncbi:MAG: hypothetical protein EZS28_024267, partial [Streblomastix strix]
MSTIEPISCDISTFQWWIFKVAFFVVEFSTVFLRRAFTKHQKPMKIWTLNIMKHIIGQIYSTFFQFTVGFLMNKPTVDGCLWSITGYHIDCTLGLYTSSILNKQVNKFAEKDNFRYKWMKIGYYGNPPNIIK